MPLEFITLVGECKEQNIHHFVHKMRYGWYGDAMQPGACAAQEAELCVLHRIQHVVLAAKFTFSSKSYSSTNADMGVSTYFPLRLVVVDVSLQNYHPFGQLY